MTQPTENEPTRLDRLETLAETILLAIQQQQAQINAVREQQDRDRQEFRETVSNMVSMVGTLANSMSEMQSEIRGLQLENRRMLDAFFNQRSD